MAALTASAVSGALGVRPAAVALGAEAPAFTVETLIALAVLGAACGLAGRLFVELLHGLKDRFGRWMPGAYQRIVLVGALVALFGLATGSRYNGLSEGLSAAALAGGSLYAWDWLAKLCLTAVCLAAGFQGGEVAPLFTIGACLGAVLAGPLGLHGAPGGGFGLCGGVRRRHQHPGFPHPGGAGAVRGRILRQLFPGVRPGLRLQRRALHLPPDAPRAAAVSEISSLPRGAGYGTLYHNKNVTGG